MSMTPTTGMEQFVTRVRITPSTAAAAAAPPSAGGAGPPPKPALELPMQRHPLALTATLENGEYIVRKGAYPTAAFECHRRWLTVQPMQARGFAVSRKRRGDDDGDAPILLYREDEHVFAVPMFYGMARWGRVDAQRDRRTLGAAISVPFVGTFRPHQPAIVDAVVQHLRSAERAGGGILKCDCGLGKTLMAISVACTLGRRAIFTVFTSDLLDNIVVQIHKWAPSARVGVMQGAQYPAPDSDFVVAMVQTILSPHREYSAERDFASFGLWVADEMHHIAAPWFSQLRRRMPCRYVLGLSATPRRRDGTTDLLHWLMGPTIVDERRAPKRILARMLCWEPGRARKVRCLRGSSEPHIPTMLSEIAADVDRTAALARWIARAVFHPEPLPIRRRVLVLSAIVAQLQTMHDMLLAAAARELERIEPPGTAIRIDETELNRARVLVRRPDATDEEEGFSVGYLVRLLFPAKRRRQAAFAAARRCQVILATFGLGGEGFDLEELDTVVVATQRADIEQNEGRPLRDCDTKNVPMIVYAYDPVSRFQDWAMAVRQRFHRQPNYETVEQRLE